MAANRSKMLSRLLWGGLVVLLVAAVTVGLLVRRATIAREIDDGYAAGVRQLEAGEFEPALHAIGRYVQRHPDDAQALFRYAAAREEVEADEGKHLLQAAASFGRAAELDPTLVEARLRRLDILSQLQFNTEALAEADEILASDHADDEQRAEALRAKALALAGLNRRGEAAEAAKRRAELVPDDFEAHALALAIIQRDGGDATALLAQADAAGDTGPLAALVRSEARRLAGEADAAAADVEAAAAAFGPADPPALLKAIVNRLDLLGRYGRADDLLAAAAATDGDVKTAWARRRFYRRGGPGPVEDVLADADAPAPALAAAAARAADLGRADDVKALLARLDKSAEPDAATLATAARVTLRARDGRAVTADDEQALRRAATAWPDLADARLWLGDALLAGGDARAAVAAWREAAGLAPAWATPHLRLADLLADVGQYDDATVPAADALARAPDDADVLLTAGRVAAGRPSASTPGGLPPAAELLSRFEAAAPEDGRAAPLRISLALRDGDVGRARDLAARLAEGEAPADVLIDAAAAVADADPAVAMTLLERSAALHGPQPPSTFARAMLLAREGQPDAGADLLARDAAAAAPPLAVDWAFARARFADLAGRDDAAALWAGLLADGADRRALLTAVDSPAVRADAGLERRVLAALAEAVGSDDHRWQTAKARSLLRPGPDGAPPDEDQIVEASLLLARVTRAAPDLLAPRLLLAQCFRALDDTPSAVAQLLVAAEDHPQEAGVQLELARLLRESGQTDRARPYLDRVLAAGSPAQRQEVARLLAADGDAADALSRIENAYGGPDAVPADLSLARLYHARGDAARVRGMLSELLNDPTPDTVVFAAEFYRSQGDAARAEALLDPQALAAHGWRPGVADRVLAETARVRGDFAQAEAHARSAVNAAPGDGAAWRTLLVTLLAGGDGRGAAGEELVEAADDAADAAVAVEGDAGLAAAADVLAGVAERAGASGEAPAWRGDVASLVAWVLGNPADAPAARSAAEVLQGGVDAPRALAELADRNPRLRPLQEAAARLNLAAGQSQVAARLATRAMQLAPGGGEITRLATLALAAEQRWGETLATARLWRDAGGDPAQADLLIASAQLNLGDADAAADRLRQYATPSATGDGAGPTEIASVLQLAAAEAARGDTEAAAELLRPGLDKSPVWRSAWARLALRLPDADAAAWLRELGQVGGQRLPERAALARSWDALARRTGDATHAAAGAEVLAEARAAAVTGSGATAEELMIAGSAVEAAGSWADAAEIYRRGLEADPGPGERALLQNNLASVLTQLGRADEAVPLAAEAVAGAERDGDAAVGGTTLSAVRADLLDTLGMARLAAGDADGAARALADALALAPDRPALAVRLAAAHAAAGRPDQAAALAATVADSAVAGLDQDDRARLDRLRPD